VSILWRVLGFLAMAATVIVTALMVSLVCFLCWAVYFGMKPDDQAIREEVDRRGLMEWRIVDPATGKTERRWKDQP
jgi:choline-glycine betaine transporter